MRTSGQLHGHFVRDGGRGWRGKNFALCGLGRCMTGDDSKMGTLVEIQKVDRGGTGSELSTPTFHYGGRKLDEGVVVGVVVKWINHRFPHANKCDVRREAEASWKRNSTCVERTASSWPQATLPGGFTLDRHATVRVGSVEANGMLAGAIVVGNPAPPSRPGFP